jgi:hypothetical protein
VAELDEDASARLVGISFSAAAQSCVGPRARRLARDGSRIGAKWLGEQRRRHRSAVLRIAGPDDAVALMKLKQRLDEETSFILLESDKRDISTQTLARHLDEVSRSGNSVVIVADARLVA